jgi:hypothetical protein
LDNAKHSELCGGENKDMAHLLATLQNFEVAFKKHYECYKRFTPNEHKRSKRLLLVYAVENGLKCILLQQIGRGNSKELQQHPHYRKYMKHEGHDIRGMLAWAGTGGIFQIKSLQCKDDQNVDSHSLHQLWRYGLETKDNTLEENVEQTLRQIADWVNDKLRERRHGL